MSLQELVFSNEWSREERLGNRQVWVLIYLTEKGMWESLTGMQPQRDLGDGAKIEIFMDQ